MNNAIRKSPSTFLTSLSTLFLNIETWVASDEHGLSIHKSECLLDEEEYGVYSAPQLTILNANGDKIAEVIPVAASVLGANGRVDIKGRYDNVTILDLNKGGPQINGLVAERGHPFIRTTPLYKGIDEAGWYWIEHKFSSKGHLLTRELFFEILDDVCEYAY
ncbi:MAG: hypothetical protein PHH59_14680 [Methylovulum sp.]|uniref:hypothetical protein n=1 Tax=Methylovulum sp. TaxID=1916980 RepID=UPI002638C840|nr:hypothetical protein [Methylovulum sp.]MDD2725251.1 hypothetical protein [Methylovulum sp.]MDD5125676.1 hypothetical protein [Methylovulum sp.]